MRLSVVVTGRHDDYGGSSYDRFARTLRFNAHALGDIETEFILVEWNPIPNRPTLFEITRAQVDVPLVGLIVDPRYHDAMTLNPHLSYLEYIAKNVGIRRARGELILVSNIDIYFGRTVVERMREPLAPGVVWRAARVDLASSLDQTTVTWDRLEAREFQVRVPTLTPPLYAGGAGDFVLLDRASWHQLRGFNEVYRTARAGIDRNFLAKARRNGLRIDDLGGPVYHFNHPGSFRTHKAVLAGEAGETQWGKRGWASERVIYDNPPSWGLAGAPEREERGARILDFDWRAVPPLVDLKRLVC